MSQFIMETAIGRQLVHLVRDSNPMYQVVAAVLLAIVLRRLLSRSSRFKLYPVWALFETGFAIYVLQTDGFLRRI